MAKLKAPLFSLGATKSIGQALTFTRNRRRNIVTVIPTHADARTPAQLAHRELYSHARDYWLSLSDVEKAALQAEARPSTFSVYNLLIQRYLLDRLDLLGWWPLQSNLLPLSREFSLFNTPANAIGCGPADDPCGFSNGATTFNGATSYASAVANQLNFTSQDFSLSRRVYLQRTGVNQGLLGRFLHGANGWFLSLSFFGWVLFTTRQAAADQSTIAGAAVLPLNTWATLGISRTGPSVRIYGNGVDLTAFPAVHIDPAPSANRLEIARYNAASGLYLQARLSDLLFYNRALSAADHLQIHLRYCIPVRP